MIYNLIDWYGLPHKVEIPDGTTEVAGVIVSGDEVLVWPVYRDPQWEKRVYDNLDGHFYKKLVDGVWEDVEEE